ncbi:MAG: N-acetylmuramoyl-L-alanine amidase, partial [Lachnospiraceae bacterium]|nr:N-acetylmuramoyl-L-alanine amidase [Lachnospiraceae bacterium]
MAYKIMVDAGHGGYDGGASYNGRLEKDDTLALSLAVGEILSGMGYDVEYTRTTDVYDSPVQKARIGNESNANLFLSIHHNSSPNPNTYKGVQTLVYEDVGLKADLARSVNNELEKVGYRNINVVERPNLAVLRRTKMPAILVEVGFINNDEDNARFDSQFDETAM